MIELLYSRDNAIETGLGWYAEKSIVLCNHMEYITSASYETRQQLVNALRDKTAWNES